MFESNGPSLLTELLRGVIGLGTVVDISEVQPVAVVADPICLDLDIAERKHIGPYGRRTGDQVADDGLFVLFVLFVLWYALLCWAT